ncbi:hypothetical protein POM88_025713 [Heracleum sosnowskyi]|uniref:Helicase ATP-binding domain-containing protein n=1 Tax=Heracleum sosnowskyi TaxID=360622 RepID=A0AAD8I4F2_9APIA|nr:hypothetical protein POM88_025713 [Heracleum sosnowskyi]
MHAKGNLTYQLPAYICPGITLVISPLVSLIQDQIMHLSQANIPAAYLSANMEWTEQQEILRELCLDNCRYKLLYVTPEKVAKSDVLLRHLENLYSRQLLARIVIDEAHCSFIHIELDIPLLHGTPLCSLDKYVMYYFSLLNISFCSVDHIKGLV